MKLTIINLAACMFLASASYALPPEANVPNVTEGSEQYDWDACVDAKSSECINACTTSEDLDCQDKCMTMAKDKCKTEGIYPAI